jgi:NAD(P)-dependent dehydrogenase (short-subunit alcohol dehydrogenase family)
VCCTARETLPRLSSAGDFWDDRGPTPQPLTVSACAQALALAAEGAAIGIVDRNLAGATAAEATRLGVKSVAAAADVADEAQVATAFGAATAALGDIDILFNNAGIDTTSLLIDTTSLLIDMPAQFVPTSQLGPVLSQRCQSCDSWSMLGGAPFG